MITVAHQEAMTLKARCKAATAAKAAMAAQEADRITMSMAIAAATVLLPDTAHKAVTMARAAMVPVQEVAPAQTEAVAPVRPIEVATATATEDAT